MDVAHHATESAGWQEAVDSGAADDVIRAIDQLAEFPVLDATVQRIVQLCDDDDATTADLVAALEVDQTFAANLLRYANSAALARPIRAKSIRQAVMLVGRRALRRLSLEAATFRFLERAPGTSSGVRGQLHLHAISVAVAAAAAADLARVRGEAPHLAGLMHDIGKLVLPLAYGESQVADVARAHGGGQDRTTAEREVLGVDHALAGALLAERWGFAPEVVDAIALHHGGPTGIASPSAEIACVQLANSVADMLSGGEADHALVEVSLGQLSLDADALDAIAGVASTPLGASPTHRIADQATDTTELRDRDDVTGLANRRHWLQRVRRELTEDRRGGVLVVSVVGLAEVTEAQGYQAANLMLTEVARVAGRHGLAGRIGGVVLALWVDGGREGAELAARQISRELDVGTTPETPISLRFGVSAPGADNDDLAALLASAQAVLAPLEGAQPSEPSTLTPLAAEHSRAA